MTGFLSSLLEFMILLPGMLAAYLPMKEYLRLHPAKLTVAAVSLVFLIGCICSAVSCIFHVGMVWLFFPAAVILGIFYVHTLKINLWKSASVFLSICGVFSCLGSTAIAVNGILSPGEFAPPLSLRGALFWLSACCLFVLVVWYPATHAARKLLEYEPLARTWYVFWVLPLLFTGLNLSMIPKEPDILDQGRIRLLYILFSFALLVLLLLFYTLFYLMASSLNHNDSLRKENQLLSMQHARYDSLCTAIEQTRQARHDMRHHFHILQSFAAQGKWENLARYLDEVQGSIPDGSLCLCRNSAVDSVAGYFAMRYQEHGIPLIFELALPPHLPVPDSTLCSVLSNLLENAMEASLKTAPERRQAKVWAHLHSSQIILLSVKNTYDGKVQEKDGIFLSSKRKGEGIGLQAVRHIAEKNGGYSQFHYEGGVFTANIILRGGQ